MNNNIQAQKLNLMNKLGGDNLSKNIKPNPNRSGERNHPKTPNNPNNNNIKPKGCGSCRRNKAK
jgi:hypothetical protein